MPQVQFQSVKQKQIPVQRVQRKVEISQLQLVQEAIQSEIRRMTLEKTFKERDTLNQAVVRIVNETARAWSIECHQYEIRESIPPASIKQAMEMQAEAEHSKREEILQSEGDQQSEINLARGEQQDCDSVEQPLSVQDPGAHAQLKPKHTRHHRSLRCHEQGIVFQCEDPIG